MPLITYPNKDKNSSGSTDQWRDVDANEVKEVVNQKQDGNANLNGISATSGDGIVKKSGNTFITVPETNSYKGRYPSLAALQVAYPTANDGDSAKVGSAGTFLIYYWDVDTTSWKTQTTGAPPTFTKNIPVSLSGGKNLGRFLTGDIILAIGKNAEEVFEDVATESIFPTYTPAAVTLLENKPNIGELGENLTGINLQGIFTQNDAGALSAIRIIKKIGAGSPIAIATGAASPLLFTDSFVRSVNNVGYYAEVDFGAGVIKTVSPGGTPDSRPAAPHSADAPQAAETNYASATSLFISYQKLFYGSATSAPSDSASVRALSGSDLVPITPVSGESELTTDNVSLNHAIVLPFGYKLDEVKDLDASNANLTANYVMSTINVADAGGTVTARRMYLLSTAVAYTSPHRHHFKYSAI